MELEKYKNNGWGISLLGFSKLLEIITSNKKNNLNVLEFGSGTSTMFLSDIVKNGIKSLTITSFDNDVEYMYKKTDDEVYLNLLVRGLVECNDENYQKQLTNKNYERGLMQTKTSALEPRQKNNFYDVSENDLQGIYDLVILDGPNGNGRNFSFLHIKNHIDTGSIIFIDDYNHYDFLEQCQAMYNIEIIFQHTEGVGNGKDNFVIVKLV